jgi:hypothetical protein
MTYRVSWGPSADAFTLTSDSAVEALEAYEAFHEAGRDLILIRNSEAGLIDLAALKAAAAVEQAVGAMERHSSFKDQLPEQN